jgi:hypothetical protein
MEHSIGEVTSNERADERVGALGDRLLEVVHSFRVTCQQLRPAELGQYRDANLDLLRSDQCPPQIAGSDRRDPTAEGRARRRPQVLDGGRRVRGFTLQQLSGNRLSVRTLLREKVRGAAMEVREGTWRDVVVNRGSQQRMRKAQWPFRSQEVRRRQVVRKRRE